MSKHDFFDRFFRDDARPTTCKCGSTTNLYIIATNNEGSPTLIECDDCRQKRERETGERVAREQAERKAWMEYEEHNEL